MTDARSPFIRGSDLRTEAGPYTTHRPTDRDAWLELRRPYFNASAAGALFNAHPFTSLRDIVAAKLEPASAPWEGNTATRRGQYLEPAIALWWEAEHGLALYEPDVVYVRGPLMATLDRRVVGNDTDCVEIKTTSRHVAEPEPHWRWQVMAQLYAADLQRAHVVVLDASLSLATYVVERDEEAIARLVDRAAEVMWYVSRGRTPPDLEATPAVRHTDRVVEFDQAQRDDLAVWLDLRAERTSLEGLEADARARLIGHLGDAQAATVDGRQVLTYRSHTRRNLDLDRLRREHPDLARELTTETVQRTLRPIEARP